MNKNTLWAIIAVVVIIAGVYYFTQKSAVPAPVATTDITSSSTDQTAGQPVDKTKTVIGASVEKRAITAYHYGAGATELLFVGGVHGGYGWNTALLAYQLMDYLQANPSVIPPNIKVTVIPVLNPDGLNKVVGASDRFTPANVSTDKATVIAGRNNDNGVDINRNFDCGWQPSAVWQKTTVSGGSKVFSEPESQAFKNYIESHNPTAVVVWFSAAGGVFASACDNGILPGTEVLTKIYATASGYQAYDSFDFYETTGDMVNWLAKKNIPAISVILSTHQDTEWSKNLAGIQAVFKAYTK